MLVLSKAVRIFTPKFSSKIEVVMIVSKSDFCQTENSKSDLVHLLTNKCTGSQIGATQ